MKKILFLLSCIVCFGINSVLAQQRYFYKMKYVKVGNEKRIPPNSCGMYITFPNGNICYDSDCNGYAVNSYWKLNYQGGNENGYSYKGITFWGEVHYYFSKDYLSLNVVDTDGNIYVFYKTISSQQKSTYYSVTNNDGGSSISGGGFVPIAPSGENGNGGSSGSGSGRSKAKVVCSNCHGTGIAWSEKRYRPNYTGDIERQWCDRCKSYDNPHYHIDHRCTLCKNGYR